MIIGFTGTQEGMTQEQKHILHRVLMGTPYTTFIHGGCIGADEQAHEIALGAGCDTIIRPGVDRKGRPNKRGRYPRAGRIMEEKYYLDRNKDIVDDSDFIVAAPKGNKEELRSGTWSTVRYARKQNKTGIIIWPDGNTTNLNERARND